MLLKIIIRVSQVYFAIISAVPAFASTLEEKTVNQDSTISPTAAKVTSKDNNKSVNVGTVSARTEQGKSANNSFENHVLSREKLFKSSQSVDTISKDELNLFSPSMSGVQALSLKPGIQINGYDSSSGTARSTISMRGVKVGWSSVPGDLETNGITAEFDGIPLNSLIQGTGWHSVEIPLGQLLSGVNVLYGPGNPKDRWYDSIGGTINFIPVQPSRVPYASISGGYGSNQSQVYTAIASTGEHDGWSAVIATAYAHSHSFRVSSFNTPTRANQVFAKLVKTFSLGKFSLGAYWQRNDEYRPNMIPISPIPGVTIYGLNKDAPLYSQVSSGFYSALDRSIWFKNNIIENYIAYAKFHLRLDRSIALSDSFWYRHGRILHYRINTGFADGSTEYYYPYSETYGNRLVIDASLPLKNSLSVGGYIINSNTVNRYRGYNELQGTSYDNPSAISFGEFENTFISAFVQDSYEPGKNLRIVPGVQFIQYGTNFFDNNLSESSKFPNAGYNTNPNTSRTFDRISPSIGINFSPIKSISSYANYSVTYQNPTAGNYNNQQTDLPALKPIKSTDYEFGFRISRDQLFGLRKIFASVNFYNDVLSNETIPVTLSNNPTVTTFGYGKATLTGINLSLHANINQSWSSFVNASYLHGYYNDYYSTTNNQSYNGYPVTDSPYLTLVSGVRYQRYFHGNNFVLNLWDQYYGHSYLFDNNVGAPTRQKIPGYNLLNFSLTVDNIGIRRIIPSVKMITLSLYLNNILNRKYNATEYVTSGGYFGGNSAGAILANPGSPRSVFVDAKVRF